MQTHSEGGNQHIVRKIHASLIQIKNTVPYFDSIILWT